MSNFIPLSNGNKRPVTNKNGRRSGGGNLGANTRPQNSLLNDRVSKILDEAPFADSKSIVKRLKKDYYRDYQRTPDGVMRGPVEAAIAQVRPLQVDSFDSPSEEEDFDDMMAIDGEGDELPTANLVNDSLVNLYASTSKKSINSRKSSSQRASTNRHEPSTSSSSIKKSRKSRLEEAQNNGEEQSADQAINSALDAQAKLRERYLLTPRANFSDFGGIDAVVVELRRLLFHIRNAALYRQLGVDPPRGFLLHGPPGVGKSALVEALAADLAVPLLRCGATEIVAGITGESEEKIRELFALAKSIRPCLLFIDEIDAITPKRESAAREMERRIVTQLITSLDGLSASDGSGDGVMVVGATNRADALDPALRRAGRFDREISVGIPDERARAAILRVLCRKVKLAEGFDYEELAHRTPGYVGADMKSLIREAAIAALERHLPLKESESEIKNEAQIPNENVKDQIELSPQTTTPTTLDPSFQIELTDFEAALKQVQPSSKREGFLATVPDVTWEDIGALADVRESLQMAILAPVRHSLDVARLGLSLSAGVLLCGPPGCGKTLLAKAIANESGINFISVKGPELLNMYVGESERAVRAVFARARHSSPCVIFFDEIDALCPKRSDGESNNVSARVVNQLLTEMDGLETRNCFMLAATNRPDIVDPAILRPGRFEKVLYVGFPSPDDRVEILWKLTKKGTRPPLAKDVDLKAIAHDRRLEDFTGADLSQIVREASLAALRERIEQAVPPETELLLSRGHFEYAMQRVKPSVGRTDRAHYRRMMATQSKQMDEGGSSK